jgi:hypothetical protein
MIAEDRVSYGVGIFRVYDTWVHARWVLAARSRLIEGTAKGVPEHA